MNTNNCPQHRHLSQSCACAWCTQYRIDNPAPVADFAADARAWGNALNEASWKFTDEYFHLMKAPAPAKLFNNIKSVLRTCILLYAEKQRPAPLEPVRTLKHEVLLRRHLKLIAVLRERGLNPVADSDDNWSM